MNFKNYRCWGCCEEVKPKFNIGDSFLYNWLGGENWKKKVVEEVVSTADGFFYRFENKTLFVSETELFGEKYKFIV